MTGLLDDLMHDRADAIDAPVIDLVAIAREGERRVRRRRTALVGGIAAASVAAALTGAVVLGRTPTRDVVADGSTAAPQVLAWVTGSTLHRADGSSVDLGARVRAWVWVGDAVAFTDAQDDVRLWTGATSEVIGRTAAPQDELPELVSDAANVSWVDADGRVVRYDTATATAERAPRLPGADPRVTAIDGAQVYAADSAGVYAWTPTAPGGYQVLSDDPGAVVLDAESGTTVSQGEDRTAVVTGAGGSVDVTVDNFADLSPDGRILSVEADDEGRLLDAGTADPVRFDHGHEWAVGYDWLDATTLAVLAFDRLDTADERASLLTCDTVTGACATDVALGDAVGELQLPIGQHLTS